MPARRDGKALRIQDSRKKRKRRGRDDKGSRRFGAFDDLATAVVATARARAMADLRIAAVGAFDHRGLHEAVVIDRATRTRTGF